MEFRAFPVEEAEGAILGHNIFDSNGRRRLRKGRALSAEDVERLRVLGRRTVYAARLDPGDLDENAAAERIAAAASGSGLRRSPARTGRVNVYAEVLGLLRIQRDRLDGVNDLEGLSLATLDAHAVVRPGRMAATLKILPYALPKDAVERAVELAGDGLFRLDPLGERRVALVITGSGKRVESSFRNALEPRLHALGSILASSRLLSVDDETGAERLAAALADASRESIDLIVVAGDTAVQDRHDITPQGIEQAGGEVIVFGAPVDPGNLLLLGRLGDIPILGAPGCSRSPKRNIVDLVLPRLLAGDRLSRRDINRMGCGGLLEDVPERPLPRSRLG